MDEEGNDVTPEKTNVRYNVKKVYMAEVSMTQIHNKIFFLLIRIDKIITKRLADTNCWSFVT